MSSWKPRNTLWKPDHKVNAALKHGQQIMYKGKTGMARDVKDLGYVSKWRQRNGL